MPPEIIISKDPISLLSLKELAKLRYGDMVKAVIDLEQLIIAWGGEMHSDLEELLLAEGSQQNHLWGFNLYTNLDPAQRLEFDSMINIRPNDNNKSRFIENKIIRDKISSIVDKLIT